MNISEKLKTIEPWPRKLIESLAFVILVLIGILDHLTGPEISFSVFYLLPIAVVAWFLGSRRGYVFSASGAFVWIIADLSSEPHYSHPLIPLWNALVRMGFFTFTAFLIGELKQRLGNEEKLARTDFLTGSANGRAFYEISEREISRSRRYGHPFTIAYIDVDDFKLINDLFGHLAGDELLRTVARTIRESLRTTDTIARMGGDEFVVLLPETGPEQAEVVSRKIRENLLAEMQRNDWPVTVSIGAVTYRQTPNSAKEMVKRADDLMYTGKKRGKNTIRYELVE